MAVSHRGCLKMSMKKANSINPSENLWWRSLNEVNAKVAIILRLLLKFPLEIARLKVTCNLSLHVLLTKSISALFFMVFFSFCAVWMDDYESSVCSFHYTLSNFLRPWLLLCKLNYIKNSVTKYWTIERIIYALEWSCCGLIL